MFDALRPLVLVFLASPCVFAGAQATATRADLANAYVRFEEAWFEREPVGAACAQASRALDAATARFFIGDATAAIAALDAARIELLPSNSDRAAAQVLSSLRIELEPPFGSLADLRPPVVKLTRLYSIDSEVETTPFVVVLVDDEGTVLRTVEGECEPDAWRVEFGGELELAATANLRVELRDTTGRIHSRAMWPVLTEDPARRASMLQGDGTISWEVPAFTVPERAWKTYFDRTALLDPATREAGARMATDLVALEADLARELEALAKGDDPYRARAGTLWRIARIGGVEVPHWTVAPERKPGAAAPPLVLAFHGAGGEESQWLEAYGSGALAKLARERGFLLVVPRTYPLVGNPRRIAALLEDIAQDHLFDPSRVLVLGHSMGAAAAAEFANHSPGLLVGVALIAGGANLRARAETPPVLFALGALDRIVPPGPCRAAAQLAREAGASVEVLEFEHHGHTTLVPYALEAALRLIER